MRTRGFLLVPTLLLLHALPVGAQSYSDPGLGLGGHLAVTSGVGAAGGSFTLGLQVRARLTGGLGVEGLVTYRTSSYESLGETVLTLTEVPVQGSILVLFLTGGPVQPYVLVGGSYLFVRSTGAGRNEDQGTSSDSKAGLHGGAGVDVRVSQKTSAFADLRYHLVELDSVAALSRLGDGITRKGDYWHLVMGVNLYF